MKHIFNRISYKLLLGSSIITSSMSPVLANENIDGQQLAMYQPSSTLASNFSTSKLSGEKLLAIADKLNSTKMDSEQQKLEFALVYTAANKGLSEAQFRLANYYIESELVAADEDKAIYWLTQAIDQGHQGAQFVYENFYESHFDIGC